MKIITEQRCTEYRCLGHPERPERISRTLARLQTQNELPIEWLSPPPVEETTLLRAHTAAHLSRLTVAQDFDADTPAYPNIYEHALRSVGGALLALQSARQGQLAMSLLRPPGHHATQDRAMGFCYLNSIAIAALEAQAAGFAKVAVFDFDVHHGNGTEAILLDRPGFAFFSVHQFPAYPGTGASHTGNCSNYPVPPGASHAEYVAALTRAIEDLRSFKPGLVAVSAGFDAYKRDPLSDAPLEVEDYHWLGQSFRRLGVPIFSVLEGGYSNDLPELILAYVHGLETG
jgi:acetoin utilization deacetylase AcuC-like enzyme